VGVVEGREGGIIAALGGVDQRLDQQLAARKGEAITD
jgi:hypothetical protein